MIFTAREFAETMDTLDRLVDHISAEVGFDDGENDWYVLMAARNVVKRYERELVDKGLVFEETITLTRTHFNFGPQAAEASPSNGRVEHGTVA